ncbi:MAG: exo-alpha-sialidase [Bacteroidota bacterium]
MKKCSTSSYNQQFSVFPKLTIHLPDLTVNNCPQIVVIIFCCIWGFACHPTPTPQSAWQLVQLPSSSDSQYPNLHASDSGIFLSWLQDKDSLSYLRYRSFDGTHWNDPQTIASGTNWFVNWADFPSIHQMSSGKLIAHHLAKNGKGTYAYGVRLTSKSPQQDDWLTIGYAHTDSSETEHGFASFFDLTADYSAIVWLDGRAYAENEKGPMSLRMARLNEEGIPLEEQVLDARVCDCCQTDAVKTPHGAIVVYRDRSDTEVRDIYRVLYRDGKWSSPMPVHTDDWIIAGCPVNGPAVASANQEVAVAWFSRGNNQARVQLAFSLDEGESFGPPIRIDLGNPEGRVDLVMLEDGSAWVSWIELEGGKGHLYVRQVFQDGQLSAAEAVSGISQSRASGFPILEQWNNELWLSWTAVRDSFPSELVLQRRKLD